MQNNLYVVYYLVEVALALCYLEVFVKNMVFVLVSCAILASCSSSASGKPSDSGLDGDSYVRKITIGGEVHGEFSINSVSYYAQDTSLSGIDVATSFSDDINATINDGLFTATIPEPKELEPLTGWNFLDGVKIKRDLLKGVTFNPTIKPEGVNFAAIKGLTATTMGDYGEPAKNRLTHVKVESVYEVDSSTSVVIEQILYIYVDNNVRIEGNCEIEDNGDADDDDTDDADTGDDDRHVNIDYTGITRKINFNLNLKKGWNTVRLTATQNRQKLSIVSGDDRPMLSIVSGDRLFGLAVNPAPIDITLECKEPSHGSKWAYEIDTR
jgi:hypothetical protein